MAAVESIFLSFLSKNANSRLEKIGLGKLERNQYKSPRIDEDFQQARGKLRSLILLGSQLSPLVLHNLSL
jgi:hypothetical protein